MIKNKMDFHGVSTRKLCACQDCPHELAPDFAQHCIEKDVRVLLARARRAA